MLVYIYPTNHATMTTEFRDNISVPGTAYLSKIMHTGAHISATTDVSANDPDAPTITDYTVGDDESFLSVSSTSTATKQITLPDPAKHEGRMIWIFDSAGHAASKNLTVTYTFDETAYDTLLDTAYECILVLAQEDRWIIIYRGVGEVFT